MGLNEHEQRVLEELERGLYAEDEQLARRMQKLPPRHLIVKSNPVRPSESRVCSSPLVVWA